MSRYTIACSYWIRYQFCFRSSFVGRLCYALLITFVFAAEPNDYPKRLSPKAPAESSIGMIIIRLQANLAHVMITHHQNAHCRPAEFFSSASRRNRLLFVECSRPQTPAQHRGMEGVDVVKSRSRAHQRHFAEVSRMAWRTTKTNIFYASSAL